MKFGCLLEKRVKENKSHAIISSIFKDWFVMSNYEYHRLGRIWILWKDDVRLTPVFKSGQVITCSISLEDVEEDFYCTFVYASNYVEERRGHVE